MTCGRTSSMMRSSRPAAASTSARQKLSGASLLGRPIIPESRNRPAPPRNRWSATPGAGRAASSSPIRSPPSPPPASWDRCARPGGMISPSSPSVQVTSVTCTPSAAYRAIVAPVSIDSSSGWACTTRRRRLARSCIMTDSFPRQQARTRNFSLGAPRSFQISPDGGTVAFLRSPGGTDPVTGLWALDVAAGTERLVADPAQLAGFGGEDDELEKALRERTRERAEGIVGFATDAGFTVAAFTLAGRVYLAPLALAGEPGPVRELPTRVPAADPRPDPSGRLVAYTCAGALRVVNTETGEDRAVIDPDGAAGISFGAAECRAAEEMGRPRGYWWAPDSGALLVARVDENPVPRWHIADPAHPAAPAREIRYPSAGTPNAEVTAFIASVAGKLTRVVWDGAAFPYLVTACWSAEGPPLLVVQSRDQKEQRLLSVDPATGQTAVLRADTDPAWTDIVPGVPAWTAAGAIAWTVDAGGARRLLVAAPGELAAAEPVTPDGLQVRQVLDVDGDAVLFTASAGDP